MMRKTARLKVINLLTLCYSDVFTVQYVIHNSNSSVSTQMRFLRSNGNGRLPDEGDGEPPMTLISALTRAAGSRSPFYPEEPIHSSVSIIECHTPVKKITIKD